MTALTPILRREKIDFLKLKEICGRAVPRYTSYPTAPHFNDSIKADQVREWRQAIPAGSPVSAYVHVPFCRQMCHYCGCNTKATLRDEPVAAYAQRLLTEIELARDDVFQTGAIDHLAWGGGTPSILAEGHFLAVVEKLDDIFGFQTNAEHCIELDPRLVTDDLVRALKKAGVNRASLGVQDFDLTVQEKIGRLQPFGQVKRTVERLREGGIEAINLDLMFGLPAQTPDSICWTIDLARQLNPDRLALFGYAHVPWMKTHQRLINEDELPVGDDRLNLEAIARAHLVQAGFEAVGIDHFARQDDPMAVAARSKSLRRNFQGYTTDQAETLIGFGASAISGYIQGYAQNAPDIGGYERAVAGGCLPVVRGIAITVDDRARRQIIEELMTAQFSDIAAVAAQYDMCLADFEDAFVQLRPLAETGAVHVTGSAVEIDPDAVAMSRIVASCFDTYLASGKARHSLAV